MPESIPIRAAIDIAETFDCSQVIICAWDGKRTQVVSFGRTVGDSHQAAEGANRVKRALGWPRSICRGKPARVQALENRLAELERALVKSEEMLTTLRLGVDSNSDNQGEYRTGNWEYLPDTLCPKCAGEGRIWYRVVELDSDNQYKCGNCGHGWWIDGDDG